MRKLILYLAYSSLGISLAFAGPNPPSVEKVLKKAGRNREELERVITYFKRDQDPFKIKAAYFLISNMDLHRSKNYYWADASGNKIVFDELSYPNFGAALKAFEAIKLKAPGIHPVQTTEPDVLHIKGNFLIGNIERAFSVWDRSTVPFADFCEYILPYRVDAEPLQSWREVYSTRFSWLRSGKQGIEHVVQAAATDMRKWFTNTWNMEQRTEPLPLLGGLQLLSRKKGNCDDISVLEVLTLRSQGYPAAVDMVPYWATSTGTHFFNNAFDERMRPFPFDVATSNVRVNDFSREPSKIIRFTFSRQSQAVASFIPQAGIPPGFMRTLNYLDVTALHVPTSDLTCEAFETDGVPKVAYAYVFNNNDWRPTWWGHIKGHQITFKQLCRGAVFLPQYFNSGKSKVASWPVAINIDGSLKTLKPELSRLQNITISWQDKYLVYAPGKLYRLYYWNNGWKQIAEQRASFNTTAMLFGKVPANALLRLVPEHSLGKERPFTIDQKGIRHWW